MDEFPEKKQQNRPHCSLADLALLSVRAVSEILKARALAVPGERVCSQKEMQRYWEGHERVIRVTSVRTDHRGRVLKSTYIE